MVIIMKKVKRIAALTGLILLVLMYVVFFIIAIFAKETKEELFMAAAFSTVVIPIMIYIFIQLCEMRRRKTHPEEEE